MRDSLESWLRCSPVVSRREGTKDPTPSSFVVHVNPSTSTQNILPPRRATFPSPSSVPATSICCRQGGWGTGYSSAHTAVASEPQWHPLVALADRCFCSGCAILVSWLRGWLGDASRSCLALVLFHRCLAAAFCTAWPARSSEPALDGRCSGSPGKRVISRWNCSLAASLDVRDT